MINQTINPIIGINKIGNEEYSIYKYPKKNVYYPFIKGVCRYCGAKLKISKAGKEYCERICWEIPDEILVRDILFYNPKAILKGVNRNIAKQMLAKLKN